MRNKVFIISERIYKSKSNNKNKEILRLKKNIYVTDFLHFSTKSINLLNKCNILVIDTFFRQIDMTLFFKFIMPFSKIHFLHIPEIFKPLSKEKRYLFESFIEDPNKLCIIIDSCPHNAVYLRYGKLTQQTFHISEFKFYQKIRKSLAIWDLTSGLTSREICNIVFPVYKKTKIFGMPLAYIIPHRDIVLNCYSKIKIFLMEMLKDNVNIYRTYISEKDTYPSCAVLTSSSCKTILMPFIRDILEKLSAIESYVKKIYQEVKQIKPKKVPLIKNDLSTPIKNAALCQEKTFKSIKVNNKIMIYFKYGILYYISKAIIKKIKKGGKEPIPTPCGEIHYRIIEILRKNKGECVPWYKLFNCLYPKEKVSDEQFSKAKYNRINQRIEELQLGLAAIIGDKNLARCIIRAHKRQKGKPACYVLDLEIAQFADC